jgi:hypothetical protein
MFRNGKAYREFFSSAHTTCVMSHYTTPESLIQPISAIVSFNTTNFSSPLDRTQQGQGAFLLTTYRSLLDDYPVISMDESCFSASGFV